MNEFVIIPNLLPSILSSLALAFSLYWTITSTIRATRTAWKISFFFLKYGTIAIALVGAAGWLYPDHPQMPMNVSNVIISGWHVLTRSDHGRAVPLIEQERRTRKPWEKFASSSSSPPSANTRSKTKKAKANSSPLRSSSKTTRSGRRGQSSSNVNADPSANIFADVFSWWPGGGGGEEGDDDGEAATTRRVLEWAVQKIWGEESVAEWPNIEVPEAFKETWDGVKDFLNADGTSTRADETDGTRSR